MVLRPLSTYIVIPVMARARGERRKAALAPTSSEYLDWGEGGKRREEEEGGGRGGVVVLGRASISIYLFI